MTEYKKIYRSSLSRAKGLGPAHSGTHHWWMQRLTAICLIPCGIWLLFAFIQTRHYNYDDLVDWLAYPIHATLILVTIWVGLYHSMLGMQVIIEDYVHHRYAKMGLIVTMKITVLLLAVASLVAIISCIGANS